MDPKTGVEAPFTSIQEVKEPSKCGAPASARAVSHELL